MSLWCCPRTSVVPGWGFILHSSFLFGTQFKLDLDPTASRASCFGRCASTARTVAGGVGWWPAAPCGMFCLLLLVHARVSLCCVHTRSCVSHTPREEKADAPRRPTPCCCCCCHKTHKQHLNHMGGGVPYLNDAAAFSTAVSSATSSGKLLAIDFTATWRGSMGFERTFSLTMLSWLNSHALLLCANQVWALPDDRTAV